MAQTTHGRCGSPEWRTWHAIKQRCLNPKQEAYAKYGAKGVTVCQEWIESFQAFFSHVGSKPSPRHSIDRIDNSKGYEPGNVRWATASEQNRNKTNNVLVEFDGQSMSIDAACHAVGISKQAYYERKARGVDPLGPRLTKIARRSRAIVGGTSDGRVTSVSALVGARPSDYLTRKRAVERANHEAQQKAAGSYVAPAEAMARTLARANDYWGLSPLRQQVIPVIVDVRKRMTTLIADLSTYTMADVNELREVAVHLGHLNAALKDLDWAHASRAQVAAKTEAAAVKLTSELAAFVQRAEAV